MSNIIKPFEALDFSDDFMFKRVMKDESICKGVLERILGVEIGHVEYHESEKTLDSSYDSKGIRMDIYLASGNARYDIEMQTRPQKAIGKRARYYQSSMDIDALEHGEDYEKMKDSYIIFICLHDPFGENYCRYTFKESCQENPDVPLEDGTVKVILNAGGDTQNESLEMKRFLDFVSGRNDSEENEYDELIDRIENKIISERKSSEGRHEYMMVSLKYQDMMREGREEGREEGLELGLAQGLEQGADSKIINLVYKKMQKNQTPSQIAEDLLEDEDKISRIYNAIKKHPDSFDANVIYNELFLKL